MENKQIPDIRLPGFNGDWDKLKLGEISEKVTEKNKENNYSETFTNSAEFGIITQRDFFEKDISNKKNLNGYYIVHPDYFVYNPRISNFAPVGPIKRNKLGRTGVMSPLYYVFYTHDVDKTYLEYYFSGNNWHRFMKLNGDSGARSDRFAIKDSVFREMPIPIPSREEQTKIGNFFKQLDDTIALHQKELINLKQTKQGFLQKMFPKKGESVPEVRFPGFTSDWEHCKLGEILKVNSGRDYKHLQQGDIPVYGTGGYMLSVNDKLSNEDAIGIGRKGTINKPQLLEAPFWTVDTLFYMTTRENSNLFFCYSLAERLNWKKYDESTGVPSLSKMNIEKIPITIPCLEEQIKIGNFFKLLGDTIALYERELDVLKEMKKAFLQKMFV